jgi:tetratricopeptide (TPR) repeat protein
MYDQKHKPFESIMTRLFVLLTILLLVSSASAADSPPSGEEAATTAPRELKDLFYGEALYYAFQGDWFDAVARLDTELEQHHGLDEPELDTLFHHVGQAEFAVGDFELAYRMHHRAGRAIKAVIEGNVEEPVRNEAIFRLARLFFRKNQPVNALHALQRIHGTVPDRIRDDLEFLRAHVLMANGRNAEAARILKELQGADDYEGFATYNLGIALMREGLEQEGRQYLDRNGQIGSDVPATLAIKDKSNLVLGDKLLEEKSYEGAKLVLDRVRLSGPFSNRALLGSGWADAFQGRFERALVPWSILFRREITDPSVQQALLAVPYAYGKLGVYSKAALLYGRALESFGAEVDKLDASIKSIREGKFLQALTREELKQDANWVVKLRELPETPETYYLLELMASHDFQESLKNYLDLEELRRKLAAWEGDLDAFEELIHLRRAYFRPLLPKIDRKFRRLDSQMRLRLEQRDLIEQRLQAMLTAPRPDHLATGQERILKERIALLERELKEEGAEAPGEIAARIRRLRGLLHWNIYTDYDRRLTEAHKNLRDLNQVVERLERQYAAFVRTRQAATQSCEGFDDVISRQRRRIEESREKVAVLMARQGHILEVMAVNELSGRRDRLAEYQIKARFALADSYDRAARAQGQEKVEQ